MYQAVIFNLITPSKYIKLLPVNPEQTTRKMFTVRQLSSEQEALRSNSLERFMSSARTTSLDMFIAECNEQESFPALRTESLEKFLQESDMGASNPMFAELNRAAEKAETGVSRVSISSNEGIDAPMRNYESYEINSNAGSSSGNSNSGSDEEYMDNDDDSDYGGGSSSSSTTPKVKKGRKKGEDGKKENFTEAEKREKKREADRKCRKRKKDKMGFMVSKIKKLEEENEVLRKRQKVVGVLPTTVAATVVEVEKEKEKEKGVEKNAGNNAPHVECRTKIATGLIEQFNNIRISVTKKFVDENMAESCSVIDSSNAVFDGKKEECVGVFAALTESFELCKLTVLECTSVDGANFNLTWKIAGQYVVDGKTHEYYGRSFINFNESDCHDLRVQKFVLLFNDKAKKAFEFDMSLGQFEEWLTLQMWGKSDGGI